MSIRIETIESRNTRPIYSFDLGSKAKMFILNVSLGPLVPLLLGVRLENLNI